MSTSEYSDRLQDSALARGTERWRCLLGRPPRMLLVEDDPGILQSLVEWFDEEGWQVRSAPDGSRFFELVEPLIGGEKGAENFDVIVTDISMPGLDVLAILEGLRTTGAMMPMVVISALPDPAIPPRVKRLGMAQFFRKPFSFSDVHRAVRALMMSAIDERIIQ